MNWVIEEAYKNPATTDRVILENPETVKRLDEQIKTVFWSFIQEEMEKTGYNYAPGREDLKIASAWNGSDLTRAVTFMLFDELQYPFFRATLECSDHGFLLNRDFSLGLPQNTNPDFMFRILSDENFSGMPPSLIVEDPRRHSKWDYYYHITFEAGTGMEFHGWTLHTMAKENIESVMEGSISMYEHSMLDGFSTMDDVDDFLKIARKVFEAH